METLIILIILVLLVIFYEKIKNKILNIKLKQNDENRKKLDNYISEENKEKLQKESLNFTQKEILRTYYLKYSNSINEQKKDIKTKPVIKKEKIMSNQVEKNIVGNHKVLTGKKVVNSSFIVFDIETTGLHSVRDEIIEIAAIKIEDINARNHKTFQSFIKPKKDIPFNITELTGITNSMVANADNIDVVLKSFNEFIEDYPLIGHNIDFDIKFLDNKMKKAKINFGNKKLIDTLPLSRKAFKNLDNHKLTTLIKALGIDVNESHRALEDAKATLFVYTTSTKLLYDK
ncbi:3'-5' exonuclease [Aliarcobacter butzleri]|uniref:3'-5' exonuclease n=1 Tax=Aliarcobacter butzleri TaxID=28197 RepID=UPI002B244EAA|nr:3'-5' exonuclease [Aliarcobacter butzleri]